MAGLLDQYAAIAEWDVSTRQTNEGFIRRTIKPALGHMEVRKVRGWARLSVAPFDTDRAGSHHRTSHPAGLELLLDWLEDQPGDSWQDRWLASGADAGNGAWRQVPLAWLREHRHRAEWRHDAFFRALRVVVSADVIRPSLTGLVTTTFTRGSLAAVMARHRDPDGFGNVGAEGRGWCGVVSAGGDRGISGAVSAGAARRLSGSGFPAVALFLLPPWEALACPVLSFP